MKSPLVLALLSVLATSAATATATEEKILPVTTVAETVSILSVDGAKIRKSEFDADMQSFTALVDVAVTIESNVMCETKSSDRIMSVLPYPNLTLSLVQECNVREELTGLGFMQLSMPRQTTVLVRIETYLDKLRDPKTHKPVPGPDGHVQWAKEAAQTIAIPFGYRKQSKVMKVAYTVATKQASVTIADAPAAETEKQ